MTLDEYKRHQAWVKRRNDFIDKFRHSRYYLSPIVYPNVKGKYLMTTMVFNEKHDRVARIFWKVVF